MEGFGIGKSALETFHEKIEKLGNDTGVIPVVSNVQMNEQPIPAHELHSVLSEAHYDLYKDVHGISPRWMRYEELTTPELEATMLALMAEEEAMIVEWDGIDARIAADEEAAREAARVEAVRAHEERYMDTAAALGACGW
jgi:hypothetical protein